MRVNKSALLTHIRTLQTEINGLVDIVLAMEEEAPPKIEKIQTSGDWLTAKELARHFRVSAATIYCWAEKGIIPAGTAFGLRQTRWKLEDVEARLLPKAHDVTRTARRGRPSKIRKKEDFIYA